MRRIRKEDKVQRDRANSEKKTEDFSTKKESKQRTTYWSKIRNFAEEIDKLNN